MLVKHWATAAGSEAGPSLVTESIRKRREVDCRVAALILHNRTAMPSGMRRTRVFGVVKGVDGARVLRSGRRLWPESSEVKLKKPKDASDWFPVIDSRGNGGGSGHGKWTQVRNVKPKRVVVVDIREEDDACVAEVPEPVKVSARIGGDAESSDVDRMFGKVYRRKRKRGLSENGDVFDEMEHDNVMSGDKMFGLRFIRRQRSRKTDVEHWKPTAGGRSSKLHSHRQSISLPPPRDRALTIFAGSNLDAGCWFADFILSVFSHLKSPVLRVAKLSAFLLSNPIHGVFASKGMRFLQGYPPTGSSGMCVIFGAMQSIPMFHLDFSAVPISFMYLHSKMFLRATWIQARLVNNNKQLDVDMSSDSEEDSVEEQHVSSPPERSSLECKTTAFGVYHVKTRSISHPSVRASRLGSRTMQYRNGFSSRGIRKRRSSLRLRRPRSHSLAAIQKTIGSLVVDDMKRSVSFPYAASCNRHKNSALRDSAGRIRDVSSTALGLAMDVDSSCCNGNILIVEADKCLREEGANIVLEFSASCEWLLVVKKDGSTRYTHKAEKVMKPPSCNRFTHAMSWSADNGWKLEFPNRRDWLVFKDLYKECSDRNIPCSSVKAIPVPRVSEVPGYVDSSSAFQRPDTYISVNDDEVCRAMAKGTANYDMDSEDEEWLSKLNGDLIATDKHHECISRDNFELMVDVFEKGFFDNPDAFSDEKAPADICMHLSSRPIVESLFTYWMKKRRQRKSCLIRVFQAHQAKRKPPVVPKPIIRRRRSFKRQPSQSGRASQSSILEAAIVSRRDAVEEQNAMQKYEEARATAEKCIETAVSKRQRAQLLLENADMAAYKAMMALRIAEAIQASDLPEAEAAATAASCFIE